MSDRPTHPQPPMDGIAIGVAIVGRDERGEPVVTFCNDTFIVQMAGTAREERLTFPIPLNALIPHDTWPQFRETFAECLRSGDAQAFDQPDGVVSQGAQRRRFSFKPVAPGAASASIEPMHGRAPVPDVMVTSIDLAPPLQPDRKLEIDALRYRAVVDSAYDAIVTIDQQHNITLFNRAAENLFGYTAAEVLGRPIVMLVPERFRANHPQHVRHFADSVQTSVRRMTAPRMDESNSVYGQRRDGSIIPVEIAIAKIDVNGMTEFTAVVRDITDRARAMELLKKQAVTDSLTGLPNRREFVEFVGKALGTPDVLSVFILDIDFFKQINDSHGHGAGDEVLRVLAKAGMSMTREANLFARWGGEEFVAALPGADADLAHHIADTLRRRIEQQEVEHAWRLEPIPFTVSIGVVTRGRDEYDVDALMRRADEALYRAKKAGRNRVETGYDY